MRKVSAGSGLRGALLLVLLGTAACSRTRDATPANTPNTPSAPAHQGGVDMAGMDRSVAPGDDFFALRERGVGEDDRDSARPQQLRASGRSLGDRAQQRTRELLEGLAAPGTRRGRRTSARSATTTPATWTRPAIEAKGLDAARSRRSTASPRSRTRARSRRGSAAACAPTSMRSTPRTSTPTACSASGSRRTSNDPDAQRAVPAAGRPRHAGPRLLPRSRRRDMDGDPRRSTGRTSRRC